MQHNPTLDDLFAEAAQNIRREQRQANLRPRQARRTELPDPALIESAALFTNPDNWISTRALTLIHEETGTVLGNFKEFLHISELNCRKLLRTDEPVCVAGTEAVAGDWWIAEHHAIADVESWHEKRTLILPLVLGKLGVHAPLCEVIVHLAYGNTARVELATDTQFAQIEGQPEQLLWLRAGVNVLLVMSQNSKIALRMELGK